MIRTDKELKVKNKKLRTLILPLFISGIVFTSYAFGSSGGEEAAHTPLWKDYMWKIINFAVLIIILWKFAKKPFQNFLKNRTELIEKTLNEAKAAKEAAMKALQEVEERLKTKDAEIESVISASRRAGEQERDKIIAETEKLKEKILEQAKTNIQFELKHAKEQIKAEAVNLAIELAEKKIKDKITKEDQEKLLDESLMKIGGRG
ncbi:MAG: F0F1 ATP synthase subunit B [Nitrospirae bacterium]|nr:F0F1 ATP synthase subunit B [Nitrospirota bacterium]